MAMNSNRNQRQIIIFVWFALFFSFSEKANGVSPETQEKLNLILADSKTFTRESLNLFENAELLQELRRIANETDVAAAKIPLIRIGDEDVINATLNELHTNQSTRRRSPSYQLGMAGNPDIIPRLIADLQREENADEDLSGEIGITPLSSAVTTIMIMIVRESPAFTPQVKEWASQLPQASNDRRAGIRLWWTLNKDALLRKDYQAVIPLWQDEREMKRPAKPAGAPTSFKSPRQREPNERPHASGDENGESPKWPWLAAIGTLAVVALTVWIRR